MTTSPEVSEARGAAVSSTTLWLTLIVVLVADGMDLMDATITNVAAPTIVKDIGGGESLVKWLTASYALALGSLLILGGRLGDRFGQRRTFLVGMGGFVVASALVGISWDPVVIVMARLLQGAFGALLIPQGMAIMTRTFPREMLTKAFGAFGPMLGIFAVGGPILAGFMIDADIFGWSWRPAFLVNVIVGGIGWILAFAILPGVDADPEAKIDPVGAPLLAAAMVALLYSLISGSSDGWTAGPAICLFVATALFAAFVRRQLVSSTPLLKPTLFANRGFVSGLIMGLLVFAAFAGLMYVVSLFFQLGLGYSPAKTSLNLLPLTIGIIVGSGVCMAMIAKLGRTLVVAGLTTTALGAGLFLFVVHRSGLDVSVWELAVVTFVVGVGAGTCFGSIFDTALGEVGQDEAGAASGSVSTIQQLANAVGSAAVTTVYFQALGGGQVHAMTVSLIVVVGLSLLCLVAVPLLPRRAAAIDH